MSDAVLLFWSFFFVFVVVGFGVFISIINSKRYTPIQNLDELDIPNYSEIQTNMSKCEIEQLLNSSDIKVKTTDGCNICYIYSIKPKLFVLERYCKDDTHFHRIGDGSYIDRKKIKVTGIEITYSDDKVISKKLVYNY